MRRRACVVIFTGLVLGGTVAAEGSNGMPEYREGDYQKAIPLLESGLAAAPDDVNLNAALLSALVYEGRVDEASTRTDDDKTRFPNAVPVLVARGEYSFYMGDMRTAERLFIQAFQMDAKCARAVFDVSRLRHAQSLYRTSRMLLLQAHDLDPDDALITSRWVSILVGDKRREFAGPFIAAHPWFYKHADMYRETASAVRTELNGQKLYEPESAPAETTLRLMSVMDARGRLQGVGLELKIEDRRPLTLLLDTGASGILVNQRAVDKAGLNHLGHSKDWGVGDEGERNTFHAIAETCGIGSLQFKHCLFRVTEGKRGVAPGLDGLIGADFFQSFLMDINFQKRTLHLTPLPKRDPNPQGYDREVPAEEKDFTPVFRFNHELCISTTMNEQATGLFLLDTGAGLVNVDTTFARLATKIAGNSPMRVSGISGEVKNVLETGHAVLEFGHYKQDNGGLLAFNINNSPEHTETRLSGILGFPILYLFRLQLDYRNGLVKFEYIFGEKTKKKK